MLPLCVWGIHRPGGDSYGRAGGDSQGSNSCDKKDKGMQADKMKLTVCEENEATINIVLKGRATPMRSISRTHRVNLSWLYDVIQNDGNESVKYVKTKQQCAGNFTKGVANIETWENLMTINGLFDMANQKISTHASSKCVVMSNRDARIAMQMQQLVEEEAGVRT